MFDLSVSCYGLVVLNVELFASFRDLLVLTLRLGVCSLLFLVVLFGEFGDYI